MTYFWVSFLLFIVYCVMTFKNAIALNEMTLQFTIVYILISILLLLFIKISAHIHRAWIKWTIGLILCLLLANNCYFALTTNTERIESEQHRLLLMLGQSDDFQQLNLTEKSIEKVYIHGEHRKGNFHHPFDYVVELKIQGKEEPYYFQCYGNGPYCNSLSRIENPF